MLSCCLHLVFHLEDGIGADQVLLCTEGEELESIVVDFPHSMWPNHLFPHQMICAYSSIKISHEYKFVGHLGFANDGVQGTVEFLLAVVLSSQGWRICADECGKSSL